MKGLAISMICGLALAAGTASAESEYEGRKYQVLEQQGDLELRQYDASLAVSVPMDSSNGAFRELFRFISGENADDRKIAMTVPVRTNNQADGARMSFFVPRGFTKDTIPAARSTQVEVEEFPAGTYAAVRFSGLGRTAQVKEMKAKLQQWIADRGQRAEGEWYLDRYDPPWTLWFNRTNEVVVRVR